MIRNTIIAATASLALAGCQTVSENQQTAIGAVAGAAIGAFGGAWLGEAWAGTAKEDRNQIGKAALVGRLLGMSIKITIGAAIFVVQLVSLWM